MNAQLVILAITATLSHFKPLVVSVALASTVSRVKIRLLRQILTQASISPVMCALQVTTVHLAQFYQSLVQKVPSMMIEVVPRALTVLLVHLGTTALVREIRILRVSAQPDTTALAVRLSPHSIKLALATTLSLQQCKRRRASKVITNPMWGNRLVLTVLRVVSALILA